MENKRRGRQRASTAVFLILIITSGLFLLPSARAAGATISLQMLGEASLSDAGVPVMVAGIWHEVLVNLTSSLSGSLTLRATLPGAGSPDMTNTYAWVRNEANNSWSDPLYATFIRDDLSGSDGVHIAFVVGVDARASPGLWTFSASEGNVTLVTQTIEVESARVGYGISAADFLFRVTPFQAADLNSQATGQYLRVINEGTVPLALKVTFDILQGALSVVNPAATAHVGGEAIYYLRASVSPLPPQLIHVQGTANVTVQYLVPSPGATQLMPTFQQPFAVTVSVSRSGYAVKEVGNVAFQTLDSLTLVHGSVTTWQVFLTGSQDVSLDLSLAGGRLAGIFANGQSLTLPATLHPTTSEELAVTLQIEPTDPAGGTVVFTLHLLSTGDTQTFTTRLVVTNWPLNSPATTVSILWMVGAALASLIFVVVGFSQYRHRRDTRKRISAATKEKRGYHARKRAQAARRAVLDTNGRKGANYDKGSRTKNAGRVR